MIKAALNLAFKSFPNSAVENCVFCFLGLVLELGDLF